MDQFITVPEVILPSGLIVPAFRAGKYISGRADDGTLAINDLAAPWVSINFAEAKAAAEQFGYKLITETQALAIAHDIVNQDINWSGGKVGEGHVYQGLHKGNVSKGEHGAYESADPEERRWHQLSNGERIHDFAGNLYTWVFDDVQGDDQGIVARNFADDSFSITTAPYPSQEKGMGDYEVWDWSGLALIRGGFWCSGSYAGVFCLSCANPDLRGDGVGFRCTQ